MKPETECLRIYGASDDLVEFEGNVLKTAGPEDSGFDTAIAAGGAEFSLYDCVEPGNYAFGGHFLLESDKGERCRVYPIYDGCWTFAVGRDWDKRMGEETPIPPVSIANYPRGGSVELLIGPEGAGWTVTWVPVKRNE